MAEKEAAEQTHPETVSQPAKLRFGRRKMKKYRNYSTALIAEKCSTPPSSSSRLQGYTIGNALCPSDQSAFRSVCDSDNVINPGFLYGYILDRFYP